MQLQHFGRVSLFIFFKKLEYFLLWFKKENWYKIEKPKYDAKKTKMRSQTSAYQKNLAFWKVVTLNIEYNHYDLQ